MISPSNDSYSPAYFAGFGWDFATGIGTVNVANLTAIWSPKTNSHDFEDAGISDILWRQNGSGALAMWLMVNGHAGLSEGISQVPTTWSVVGTRDFNGDGIAVILWHNTQTGDMAIWSLNMSGQFLSGSSLGSVGGTTWTVVGTGDFNGDGVSDILWRDSAGDLAIWLINNDQLSLGGTLGQVPTTWSVAETGDFDGNGRSDILWIDSSGDLGVWLMSGLIVSSSVGLGNVGTSWTVQGQNAD